MESFHQEVIAAGSDCAVLKIVGEVDVYTTPQLREQVIRLVNDGFCHIVADLREVEFLDSTGLGALVGSLKRLRFRDGTFELVIGSGRVFQILQITGLTNAFVLHSSVLEAVTDRGHWQAAIASEGHDAEEWCRKHELS
jgi:anti-sigma B factor antagonist